MNNQSLTTSDWFGFLQTDYVKLSFGFRKRIVRKELEMTKRLSSTLMKMQAERENCINDLGAEVSMSLSRGNHRVFLDHRARSGSGVLEVRYEDYSFLMECNFLDLRSSSMSLMVWGGYEPTIQKLLNHLIGQRPNQRIFIDIGANEGFHSLNLASRFPDLEIHSFEPNFELVERMLQNINANSQGNRVTVHQFALGNGEEVEGTLHIPLETGSAGASLRELHPDEGESRKLHVGVVTLDSFSLNPGVIKIDVEGAEIGVLLGAMETIREYRPSLIVELLRKWMAPFGDHPNDALRILGREGYLCFAIGENNIRGITQIDEHTEETNFLFIPEENKSIEDSFLPKKTWRGE